MPTPTGCVCEQSRMPLKIRKYSCAFLMPRNQYNAWLPHNKTSNQSLKGMRQGKAFEFDPSQNRIRTLRPHAQPKSTILMHTELAKQSEELWRTAAASRDQTLSCDKRINLWKPWSRLSHQFCDNSLSVSVCVALMPARSQSSFMVRFRTPLLHFYHLKNSPAPVLRPDFFFFQRRLNSESPSLFSMGDEGFRKCQIPI